MARRALGGAAMLVLLGASMGCGADHADTGSRAGVANAAPPATVRVQGASESLPMLAALNNGYFAAENLSVEYTLFGASKQAFAELDAGQFEILIASADNFINYRLNPNNALLTQVDAQIIFGHDLGLDLSLVALPEFSTTESMRGRRIGVDAPNTGFAMVAAQILSDHGMGSADYTLVAAGAAPLRLAGLRASPPEFEATIINADNIVRAREDGFSVLASVDEVAEPYAGGVAGALASWLRANPDVATRFIRGFARGMDWIMDTAHRAEVVAMLTDAETTPELAGKIYDAAVGPGGLSPHAALSTEGLLNVLQIRADAGGYEVPQDLDRLISPEGELVDPSYYDQALSTDAQP